MNTVMAIDSVSSSSNTTAWGEVISMHGLSMPWGCFNELGLPSLNQAFFFPEAGSEASSGKHKMLQVVDESVIFSASLESQGLCVPEWAVESFVPVFEL